MIELFGMAKPVAEQVGWRHFLIERRLLGLGGPALAARIIEKKHTGSKTEPAFAAALGLGGDPYAALLALEPYSDAALRDLVEVERSRHLPDKSAQPSGTTSAS